MSDRQHKQESELYRNSLQLTWMRYIYIDIYHLCPSLFKSGGTYRKVRTRPRCVRVGDDFARLA